MKRVLTCKTRHEKLLRYRDTTYHSGPFLDFLGEGFNESSFTVKEGYSRRDRKRVVPSIQSLYSQGPPDPSSVFRRILDRSLGEGR